MCYSCVQVVEAKKRSLDEAAQRRREERNCKELREWEGRYSFREKEARLKGDEDKLKELSVSLRTQYSIQCTYIHTYMIQ